ncbi:ras-related protein Rab-3-like [Oppia nitens]|uniref:ras-related protein Rab-3-like n=1 Tax=Oppia nitens TaxID=1686743 RepID=UPI0023DAD83B|nr:ras-related protein Rab-3-like [Oppia nitens]
MNDYPNKSAEPDRRRRQSQENQRTSSLTAPTGQTSDRGVVTNNSADDNDYDLSLKLLVIGNSSVGKSAFIYRYTDYTFNICTTIPTVGVDLRVKTIDRQLVDDGLNRRLRLEIWDMAGQDSFRTLISSYFRKANGCLLMYDVSDRQSFQCIEQWLEVFRNIAPDGAPVVLVGNKCDISGGGDGYDDNDSQHRQYHQPKQHRVISYEMGQQLADKLELDFYETSAKDNINVDNVFDRLVDLICDDMLADILAKLMTTSLTTQLLTETIILSINNNNNNNNNNSDNKSRKNHHVVNN